MLYKSRKLPVPAIIVGNITVGGSGKTPLVAYLIKLLKEHNFKPAIVTRGYKGKSELEIVNAYSKVANVGDEALMLFNQTKVPVMVAKNRFAGAKALLKHHKEVNIIIYDDGLQNYSIPRDIEIAVIDSERKFGNNLLLPAGPLREPITKLSHVDFIILNKSFDSINSRLMLPNKNYNMSFEGDVVYNLLAPQKSLPLSNFYNKQVISLSAIGNNARFVKTLTDNNLIVKQYSFLDHYCYQLSDLNFSDKLPIITTSKDAVKLLELYNSNEKKFTDLVGLDIWVYPITAKLSNEFNQDFLAQLTFKVIK